MSAKNSKIASQAIKEMQEINEATKKVGKEMVNSLLSEAIKTALREAVDEDDDEVVVQDDETNGAEAQASAPADTAETAETEAETPVDDASAGAEEDVDAQAGGEDSWDNYEQYKVGDDTYDLSGEEDYDNVVKVYKLLKDDDQIIVKKEGNKIELKDNENDAEYVIDLGMGEADDVNAGEPAGDEAASEPTGDEVEVAADNVDGEEEELKENKKTKKTMKEQKEVIFEIDLGYTDNYQDKDPIDGLSMTEPSKSGKDWHKGVPTGTEKPWAGSSKDKGEPFEKTINEEDVEECGTAGTCENEEPEIDEGTNVTLSNRRKKSKSHSPQGKETPRTAHHDSQNGNYKPIEEEVKKIKAENKALKEAVVELRSSLRESYMTTLNLGKITKLFLENTTTHAEKVDIINRFSNEAKTPEQSKALYESINKSLKDSKPAQVVESKSMTVEGSKINENKSNKPKDLLDTIDFMNRVMKY